MSEDQPKKPPTIKAGYSEAPPHGDHRGRVRVQKTGASSKNIDQKKPGTDPVLRAPKRATTSASRVQSRKGSSSGRKKIITRRDKSAASQRRKTALRGVRLGFVSTFVCEVAVFGVTGLMVVALGVAFFAHDIPDTDSLWRPDRAPRYTILAANGAPLAVRGTQFGAPVRLADLPPHVTQAVLAVEDRNFRHHFGVNPFSVLRALMVNASEGSVKQGGSTITQQLAKNLFLSSDKTMKRKVQELLLALWLERRFSKDEILTLYLNRVYLGAGAYGIDAASHRYFGKPASALSLNEAALIAGLLKAPSRYNPTHNPKDAGIRAQLVVESMVAAGYISQNEAEKAISTPIYLKPPTFSSAGYFIDHVRRETKNIVGDYDADLIIRTTLDPDLQFALETGLSSAVDAGVLGETHADTPEKILETAIVVADQYGSVRALIGGRDYGRTQFNRATQSRRQPGSAFKPFIYLAAIEAGARPDHMILDAPITIGDWSPDNYKGKFYGNVTLTDALARSMNSATIRVQEWVGRDRVRTLANAMGFPGTLNPDPALALGVDAVSPYHLTQAWLPFANGGYRADTHVIASIETAEGIPLYQHTQDISGVAASPYAIEQVNEMLRAVTHYGTGRNGQIPGHVVAGKTGTTQGSRDAWFAGHTGGLVCVVWVGRDDYTPMDGVTGGRAPAKIWSAVMSEIFESVKRRDGEAIEVAHHQPGNLPKPVRATSASFNE